VIGNGYDSQLWKGLAFARDGNGRGAGEVQECEFSVATLPPDLQRIITMDSMKARSRSRTMRRRAAQERLDVVGVPGELRPAVAVLQGRLAEALGRRRTRSTPTASRQLGDRQAAADEGRLLEILLRQKRGEIGRDDVLKELELCRCCGAATRSN